MPLRALGGAQYRAFKVDASSGLEEGTPQLFEELKQRGGAPRLERFSGVSQVLTSLSKQFAIHATATERSLQLIDLAVDVSQMMVEIKAAT
jgi:hypothetical protein